LKYAAYTNKIESQIKHIARKTLKPGGRYCRRCIMQLPQPMKYTLK
jgi:hypothetical protein